MNLKSEDIELGLLLEAIYLKYGYDFRNYSRISLKRRLRQACEKLNCRSFSMLQDLILNNPDMVTEILSFMTIQVSEMFRDPLYYKAVRDEIIPLLHTYPSLRIWVAGCSYGEEFYSLAILFKEEGLFDRTIFYCTDINNDALDKAKKGVFEFEKIKDFTRNYQMAGGKKSFSEYYTASYDSFIMDKSLRQNVVFSDHSLVTDKVFAEMHFISCRNVLIYFNRELQDVAIGLFNDSLVRNGYLGIGSKETLQFSAYYNSFQEVNRKERLYKKI
tara:strand:- start:1742 stop:2560 length:819 start_codon:yes stop_codon:yes gene_type:complete